MAYFTSTNNGFSTPTNTRSRTITFPTSALAGSGITMSVGGQASLLNVKPISSTAYTPMLQQASNNRGMFGQTITTRSSNFYANYFNASYSGSTIINATVQDVWFVGGETGVSGGTTPLGNAAWSTVVETLDTTNPSWGNTALFTITNSAFNNYFPSCAICETPNHNGSLFFAGGFSTYPTTISTSAYIFNKDGTSKALTAGPATARSAVRTISNKQIMICGGASTSAPYSVNTISYFDPQLEVWATAANPLTISRRDHKIIAIKEGTTHGDVMLVVGGRTGQMFRGGQTNPIDNIAPKQPKVIGQILNNCELVYTSSSSPLAPVVTGNMTYARTGFGITKLGDGRILVCGGIGWDAGQPPADLTQVESLFELRSCEIYDPNTGFWSPVSSMLQPHSYCVCEYVPLANKVYVYGGVGAQTFTNVEYLDLNDMTWHNSTWVYGDGVTSGFTSGAKLCQAFLVLPGGGYIDGAGSLQGGSHGWNNCTIAVPEYVKTDGLNTDYTITNIDSGSGLTTLTTNSIGSVSNNTVNFSANVMVAASVHDITQPTGPFSYDLAQPFSLQSPIFTLNQNIKAGASYSKISVTSGAMSMVPGYLLIAYGYNYQCGPIQATGYIDNQTLITDPGFVFPYSINSGATIFTVTQLTPFEPSNPNVGSFYLTASNAGREAAITMLDNISATGIELNITTRYPGDRGLGNEGYPDQSPYKVSDVVEAYGIDDLDQEMDNAHA